MRKLASIQEVKNVLVHENADALELAKINGWQCVIKKGEFQAGDLGVYFEIDSFLPASDERFSFLKDVKTFEGVQGFRIRTIKLRNELSQGLILPISLFPELEGYEIGADVTEQLAVLKYEKPMPISSEAKGNFPSFIEKTDQERIQNLRRFDTSGVWEQTEKLDGSSMTVYLNENVFGVCSRNLELEETDTNPMWNIAKEFHVETKLRQFGKNIALQGEIIGGKIQSNRYKVEGFKWFIYDVYDIDNKRKYLPGERQAVLEALNTYDGMKLESVPVLGFVSLPEGENWMDTLLEAADGQSTLNQQAIREGDVFKHTEKNVSFKVISNRFLLKYED